ncbi:MAG: hypothetical protein P8X74_22355 [Reinekea sp.]
MDALRRYGVTDSGSRHYTRWLSENKAQGRRPQNTAMLKNIYIMLLFRLIRLADSIKKLSIRLKLHLVFKRHSQTAS